MNIKNGHIIYVQLRGDVSNVFYLSGFFNEKDQNGKRDNAHFGGVM